jgi:tripartite-type tricarboxylate transporter receptor subunit TctC
MSADLVKKYNQALVETLAPSAVRERLNKMEMVSAVTSAEETAQVQRKEHLMWGPIVKASLFTPED